MVLKVPLSIIDAFRNQWRGCWARHDQQFQNLWLQFWCFSNVFFFGYYKLCRFPQYNTTNNLYRELIFIYDVDLRFHRRSEFRGWELLLQSCKWFVYNCDIVFFEGTCQRFSYSFELDDSVGSTILKNIPTTITNKAVKGLKRKESQSAASAFSVFATSVQ